MRSDPSIIFNVAAAFGLAIYLWTPFWIGSAGTWLFKAIRGQVAPPWIVVGFWWPILALLIGATGHTLYFQYTDGLGRHANSIAGKAALDLSTEFQLDGGRSVANHTTGCGTGHWDAEGTSRLSEVERAGLAARTESVLMANGWPSTEIVSPADRSRRDFSVRAERPKTELRLRIEDREPRVDHIELRVTYCREGDWWTGLDRFFWLMAIGWTALWGLLCFYLRWQLRRSSEAWFAKILG